MRVSQEYCSEYADCEQRQQHKDKQDQLEFRRKVDHAHLVARHRYGRRVGSSLVEIELILVGFVGERGEFLRLACFQCGNLRWGFEQHALPGLRRAHLGD